MKSRPYNPPKRQSVADFRALAQALAIARVARRR